MDKLKYAGLSIETTERYGKDDSLTQELAGLGQPSPETFFGQMTKKMRGIVDVIDAESMPTNRQPPANLTDQRKRLT